jgi:hypothetical protein
LAVANGEAEMSTFTATWRRARATGGAFSVLLSAYERYEEDADRCNTGLEGCEAAIREIDAYTAPASAGGEGE